jgi:hypothetical protein
MIVKDFGSVKDFRSHSAKILHETKILRDHGTGRALAYRVKQAYEAVGVS